MSPSTYSLFNFHKGQYLRIPDDFSKIDGWLVTQFSTVEVLYNNTVAINVAGCRLLIGQLQCQNMLYS